MNKHTFIRADDNALVSLISTARRQVVFAEPGVRAEVAKALVEALGRKLPGGITVILDVDAEVCRIGYGEIEAMDLLRRELESTDSRLFHHAGIRIGLLIADETTLVYSPVPLLIEDVFQQTDKPNAIVLTDTVPTAIAEACGIGQSGDATRQVGLDFVAETKIAEVKADLKANPPKQFDLARIERVFTSALHYVELEVKNYRLQSRKLKIDSELFGLNDHYFRENIENTFKPFEDANALKVNIKKLDESGNPIAGQEEEFGPEAIDREREDIKQKFLGIIPGFGVVIRRTHQAQFEKRVHRLIKQVEAYAETVNNRMAELWKNGRGKLVDALLPRVLENPPSQWHKQTVGDKPTEAEARALLIGMLDHAYHQAIGRYQPTIKWIY